MGEFEKRGVQVLGVSMDDAETHARWRQTAIEDGGIGEVKYPLLADTSKQMTNDFDWSQNPSAIPSVLWMMTDFFVAFHSYQEVLLTMSDLVAYSPFLSRRPFPYQVVLWMTTEFVAFHLCLSRLGKYHSCRAHDLHQ